MRRCVIFLLILAIPLGLLGWTNHGLTLLQDDVVLDPLLVMGDPETMGGRSIRAESWSGDHMQWVTEYTPGGEPVSRTEFSFVQSPEHDGDTERGEFSLYLSGSVGMATTGGFALAQEGMARAVRAVADQTLPGQQKTMTLRLEDYLDYYALSYDAYINKGRVYLWESCDWYTLMEDDREAEILSYQAWAERFRFPVIPGQEVEVSVTKDRAGNINDIGYTFENAPMIGFSFYAGADGMYFSPSFANWDGQPLDTGEYPQGSGLYYIPYVITQEKILTDGGTRYQSGFDFNGLELVYAMDYDDQILSMEADEENGLLHMLIQEEGRFIYNRMDLNTRAFVARLDLGTEYSHRFQYFLEDGLLLLNGEGWISLVDIAGEPRVEFTIPLPEGAQEHSYADLRYEDGVLYLAGNDWYGGGEILVLAVCDKDGMKFYGQYAWDQWQSYDYVYGMRPTLTDVRFQD